MDPISIIASTITILQAAGSVVKGLHKLLSLKDAPACLLQLDNEMTDLQLVTTVIQDLCRRDEEQLGAGGQNTLILHNVLQKIKAAVLELQVLVERTMKREMASGRGINYIAWVYGKGKISTIQDQLHAAIMNATAVTSILNLAWSQDLKIQLNQLHHSTEDLLRQGRLSEQLMQALLNSIVQRSTHSSTPRERNKDSVANTSLLTGNDQFSPSPKVPAQISAPCMLTSAPVNTPVQFDLTYTRSYRYLCTCSCHIRTQRKSPSVLNNILGLLLLEYNLWPSTRASKICDASNCHRRGAWTAKYLYSFPLWFTQRMIFVKFQTKGPELLLRVLRVRPNDATIFLALENNNIRVVKQLLFTGDASVLDVNENGQSLIHCSLGRYWPSQEILRVLLDAGADMMQEDNNLMTPYMEVWKYHLVDSPLRRGYDFFGTQPQIDHFGFSPLHTAILGFGNTEADTTINSASRLSINDKDAMGRTPLLWATLRGDTNIMEQLLMKGADPNIGDNLGSTPLHQSVTNGSERVLDALLAAGANINAIDYLGRTALMEVIRCRNYEVDTLQRLFTARSNVSSQGLQGCTQLNLEAERIHANVETQPYEPPVEHELHVNIRTVYDRTPLIFTARKAHHVLEHLLKKGADYTIVDSEQRSILHIAADYGDPQCLHTLRQADLKLLCVDNEDRHGHTAMDIAVWRRDDNVGWSRWAIREPDPDPQEWFEAFEEMYFHTKHSYRQMRVQGIEMVGGNSRTETGYVERTEHVDRTERLLEKLPGRFPPD